MLFPSIRPAFNKYRSSVIISSSTFITKKDGFLMLLGDKSLPDEHILDIIEVGFTDPTTGLIVVEVSRDM